MALPGICHFDLKCDNILVTDAGAREGEYILRVCVADLGESVWLGGGPALHEARGTENVQSPEMVSLASSANNSRAGFDRRREYDELVLFFPFPAECDCDCRGVP